MSNLVSIPKSDWVAALDAIREKTGVSDKMASGEVAEKIRGISGGTTPETCTVTIISSSLYYDVFLVFYNSLENGSIIGKLSEIFPRSTITINALQGSVITIIDHMNIGVLEDYGMENCSISNGGALLCSIKDQINVATCALAIQLPKSDTCTITLS